MKFSTVFPCFGVIIYLSERGGRRDPEMMTSKMYNNENGDSALMFGTDEIRVSVTGEFRDHAFDTTFQADRWLRDNGYTTEDGSGPETMTLAELRKLFPLAEFDMYDAQGRELRRTPHLYMMVNDFERHIVHHEEDGDHWTTERLSIELEA